MATAPTSVVDISSVEELYRPSWVEPTSLSSSNCRFTRPCLVAVIIFPIQMTAKNHWSSWHCVFKGALSRYSVILCRFLQSKMAARRLETAAPANEKQAFAALFFFTSFELRDQSTSGYQSITLAKSFLSRTKMGFEVRSRKWKQKDKFAHEKWGIHGTKTGLQRFTDRSWVVLVRRSFKTREAFRCSCVYFATQYNNVHYDNEQAGHLLSVLRLELEMHGRHYFPQNKMAQKITD